MFSLVPIKILGAALNLVHQCLLHSLYCFEYKWFSQVCPSKCIWSANLPSSCCPGDWASPAPWLHRDELAIFPWLWTSACSHHKSPGESGAGIVVVLFVMIQYIPSSGHCWLCLFCHISTLHCLWQPGHCLKELFIFSFLFFQLFGVFQAVIETSPGIRPINVFSPTIVISNAVFSRTITTQPKWSRQPFRSTDTRLN